MWYLHLAAWRGSCCKRAGQSFEKVGAEVEEEKRTLEDVAGKVALVLAAAGSGGRTVRVGVLPLLEELLGLVEQDLAREGESVDYFQKGLSCSSSSIGVLRWRQACRRRRRLMVVQWRKRLRSWTDVTHSLLSRLADVGVGLEKRANVKGLTAPEVAVD